MRRILLALVMAVCMAGAAVAQPYAGSLSTDGCDPIPDIVATPCQTGSNQEIHKAIGKLFADVGLPNPGLVSNADVDVWQYTLPNSYWSAAGASSGAFAIIGISAANQNTLGVYQMGAPGSVTAVLPSYSGNTYLGSGTVADPYPGSVNPLNGNVFGFTLASKKANQTNVWYSDPSLNSDGIDHMLTYHLPQFDGVSVWMDTNYDGVGDKKVMFDQYTFLLSWEDLARTAGTFDNDYNDSIFLVAHMAPHSAPEPVTMALLGGGLLAMIRLRREA